MKFRFPLAAGFLIFSVLTPIVCAQQATVTISSGGNSNSKGVVEAFCLASGTSCKVTGNRTHHAGPRTCSMSCSVDEIAVFICEDNNASRDVDEFYVPALAVAIDDGFDRKAFGWVVSGSDSASCSYTD